MEYVCISSEGLGCGKGGAGVVGYCVVRRGGEGKGRGRDRVGVRIRWIDSCWDCIF